METGLRLKSLIQQTGGARDEIQDLWVQGEWFIYYIMATPRKIHMKTSKVTFLPLLTPHTKREMSSAAAVRDKMVSAHE